MSIDGMSNGVSADDEPVASAPPPPMTELERNALARAERLQRLRRAQADNGATDASRPSTADDEDGENKPGGGGPIIFRSYQPIGDLNNSVVERDENAKKFTVVERKIEDMIKDSREAAVISDELDLNILAPKKVDWDLRRGVQPKLDLLNKRTEKAISQLIRKRLEEGDSQLLPAAINSALKAQEQRSQQHVNDNGGGGGLEASDDEDDDE